MIPDFLSDAFKWLLDAVITGIGRLLVTIFSLGLVRNQRDDDRLAFPLYGIVKDAERKIVVSSGVARFIGALVFAAACIAAIVLLSDIPI